VRFLLDQDVYAITCRLLRDLGHDVVTADELNPSRSPDRGLLMWAADEKRLFVTRDKDFGGLVFVERLSKGVLYLRISPETLAAMHEELKRVLTTYSEAEFTEAFIMFQFILNALEQTPFFSGLTAV
jgi:predicted nuclease of predicted toxin-antitoxin system